MREKSPKRRSRIVSVIILAAVAVMGYGFARLEFIEEIGISNGRFRVGRYKLLEERWDHPKLQTLRRREKLDAVVAPGRTQFEKIVLLRHWTRAQWTSAAKFHYPPWDALEILDLARKKQNYGFCAQYAIVFLQACRSLGLHARYIDLGHFLAAVWSDEFDKWVVMDPTNDIYFEKDGIPLNGRELNEAAWTGKTAGIDLVQSDGSRSRVTTKDIEPYKNYSIILTNYELDKPIEIAVNGRHSLLRHQDDYHAYPMMGDDHIAYGAFFLAWHAPGQPLLWPDRTATEDPDDFHDWQNQTIIFLASREAKLGLIKLRLLNENAPDFQNFMVRLDERPWADSESEIILNLPAGKHTLRARVKTKAGWLGPESSITLYCKKDWLSRSG